MYHYCFVCNGLVGGLGWREPARTPVASFAPLSPAAAWAVRQIEKRPYDTCASSVLIHGRLLEDRLTRNRQCPDLR